GGLVGATSVTIQATMNPNVTTSVGGHITAAHDVLIESSVFTSVNAAHEAESFSLGIAAGTATVNAEDATSVSTKVGAGASVTSTGGTVKVLAYHNFDGTGFVGSDDVEANSEAITVALLLAVESTNLSASAHASVTAQVDAGGTLAAPSDEVVLQAMGANFAN